MTGQERDAEDLREDRRERLAAGRYLKQLTGNRLGEARTVLQTMANAEAGEYADGDDTDRAIGYVLYGILSPEQRFGSRLPEGADPGAQRLIIIADLDDLSLGIGKQGNSQFRQNLVEAKTLYVTGSVASTIIEAALAMYEQPRSDRFSGRVYREEEAFHQAEAHSVGLTMGLHRRPKTWKPTYMAANTRALIRNALDLDEQGELSDGAPEQAEDE